MYGWYAVVRCMVRVRGISDSFFHHRMSLYILIIQPRRIDLNIW